MYGSAIPRVVSEHTGLLPIRLEISHCDRAGVRPVRPVALPLCVSSRHGRNTTTEEDAGARMPALNPALSRPNQPEPEGTTGIPATQTLRRNCYMGLVARWLIWGEERITLDMGGVCGVSFVQATARILLLWVTILN